MESKKTYSKLEGIVISAIANKKPFADPNDLAIIATDIQIDDYFEEQQPIIYADAVSKLKLRAIQSRVAELHADYMCAESENEKKNVLAEVQKLGKSISIKEGKWTRLF